MFVDGHPCSGDLLVEYSHLVFPIAAEVVKKINVVLPGCSYLELNGEHSFKFKLFAVLCQRAMHSADPRCR